MNRKGRKGEEYVRMPKRTYEKCLRLMERIESGIQRVKEELKRPQRSF